MTLIVAVRQGLVEALDDLASLNGVQCSYAYKRGKEPRESVWTVDGVFNHVPASLRAGKTFRDEDATFGLRILVRGVSKPQEWTSARAVEIGAVVEDFVAIHGNWLNGALGVTVQTMTVEGAGELVEAFNDNGTLAELTLPIRYTARLT